MALIRYPTRCVHRIRDGNRGLQARLARRSISSLPSLDSRVFVIADEVQDAVRNNRPVVALETTIYTHGFPYPDNVALASHLESVVRMNGGVPATIGILNGVARVGLGPEEIIELASAAGKPETMKVSRRDLAYITGLGLAGRKLMGGTTIAGTMLLAKHAGIEIFGTGGLGGVHRGGENSMDVSADLTELGRTGVTVISSGPKAFLDIPRTLEFLETQGVFVGTFADGRSGPVDVPAFYSRDSGIQSPSTIYNEQEAAAIIYARRLLNVESGLFLANPIPKEHAIHYSEMAKVIDEAVNEAAAKGAYGHANTPFILAKIKELTDGNSIIANRALIESNVARATKVALELCKLTAGKQTSAEPASTLSIKPLKSPMNLSTATAIQKDLPVAGAKVDVLVAGSVAVDLSCDYTSSSQSLLTPISFTSNPSSISQSIGGVGHNVAHAAHLVASDLKVRLCSVTAKDLAGDVIATSLDSCGLDDAGVVRLEAPWRTAQYVAINDGNKDLFIAMADMNIIGDKSHNISEMWQSTLNSSTAPKAVVIDANWHWSKIHDWIEAGKTSGATTAFEPVSVAKCASLFPSALQRSSRPEHDHKQMFETAVFPRHRLDLSTPNDLELAAMHMAARDNGYFDGDDWWNVIDSFGIPPTGARVQLTALTTSKLVDRGIPQQAIQLLPFIPTIITKLGAAGVLLTKLLKAHDPILTSREHVPYILSRCNNGNEDIGGLYMRLFPAAEKVSPEDVVSVNGVGDTFLGVLVAGVAKGMVVDERLIGIAQRAAVMSLKSRESVSPELGSLAKELVV